MADFTVQYTDAGFLDFNNSSHVDNFLEYLFRTDVPQKWTTNRTIFDLFVYVKDGRFKVMPFFPDLDMRKKMFELSKLHLQIDNLTYRDITRGLLYFDLVTDAGTVSDVATVSDHSFLIDLISIYKISSFEFGVVHLDQGQAHFHMILKK